MKTFVLVVLALVSCRVTRSWDPIAQIGMAAACTLLGALVLNLAGIVCALISSASDTEQSPCSLPDPISQDIHGDKGL